MAPYTRFPVLLVSALTALGALSACGGGDGGSGTAASTAQRPPATTATGSAAPTGTMRPGAAEPTGTPAPAGGRSTAPATASARPAASSRCHTGDLRASVGRNDPGAGQENFPVVLTNTSTRTCTVYGFPGAAFVDASGRQLGPDPRRGSGTAAARVTLAPGSSAWAGLTFSNPEISEARTATPAALLVTPPDERESLRVPWRGGPVPVGGNASAVTLTPFAAGTGA
ncbi:DUF4232 domain-containing protein [Streptomyces sp. NPDC028635]|uniref:DUF4232 domain-containing protein n=1 Tax=Streptomyces sp. NPDC028635 TaxID=3154800 RepID=UPI0033E11399